MIKRIFIILFMFLSTHCQGQQTAEKIAADKLSALDYVNNQTMWLKQYLDAEIRAVREAVDKVDKTNTAYRETQNEWRSQLKDQAGTFVTKSELWVALVGLGGLIITGIGVMVNYLRKQKKENG